MSVDVTLRAYRADDREQVRDICCRTAFRNRGSQALLDDPALFADYWTGYYTDHEPESILIAARGSEVLGYLLGCQDSARFMRIMARSIVPSVASRLLWRGATLRYRSQPHAGEFFRWLLLRSWREAPPVDVVGYPAHYHVNLIAAGYRERLYTRLALVFLDQIERAGITHLHGQVLDASEDGVWRRMIARFSRERPDARFLLDQRPSTMGTHMFGSDRPYVNLLVASSVSTYRDFLEWSRERYRL